MRRLYRLYVALTLFSAFAIAIVVFLDHRVTAAYSASVTSTQHWIRHDSAFTQLLRIASALQTPLNDVFQNNDVRGEEARMHAHIDAFRRAMTNATRLFTTDDPEHVGQQTVHGLEGVNGAIARLETRAGAVFDLLRDGKTAEAAALSADVDRIDDDVRAQLVNVRDAQRSARRAEMRREQEKLTVLRRDQYAVAALMAFIVLGLAIYGWRLLRAVGAVVELERREEELRRANVAFEHALSGAAFIDASKRFTFVSRAFAAALGYDAEELIGARYETVVVPDEIPRLLALNAELHAKQRAVIETRGIRKDGGIIEARVIRVLSPGGEYAFATDITEQKRAEDALRRSEERFHLATRATKDVVFEWNVATGASWVSEAWEHQFGYSASGDIDHDAWMRSVHPDDAEKVAARLRAAIAAGEESFAVEYRFRRADGTYADVEAHAYVARDASGAPQRVIGATTDITERKRAERAYTTLLLNCAADGIYGVDLDGIVTFANDSTGRQLGWNAAELIGRNMHQLAHHHRADGTVYPWHECPACQALRTGAVVRSDGEVYWRKDGSSIAVEYASTPIRDAHRDDIIGAVVTFRDISERKTIERMKDEFVSVLSNELRTPLTSIRGALGLLVSGRLNDAAAKRMLGIAVANTDCLVRLINDILDIERIESGTIALSRTAGNACDLLKQAIELMKPSAEKANVRLVISSCDVPLFADVDRLLQTLANLLSNAIKFSPPGSVVTLSARTEAGNVVFEVADQGRGIPADKLDVIFEKFQQVDASDSRQKGGTGLGLAICRSLVRQHGGEISVESRVGEGSRFRFTIPQTGVRAVEPSAGRTVIVCDDDPSVRDVMSTLLEEKGYRAMPVASGPALLSVIEPSPPDVILLDLLMPEMNGCEALAVLKGDARTASIPVVIMSVFSPDESDWPMADLAGWIRKPFDETAVVHALENALGTCQD